MNVALFISTINGDLLMEALTPQVVVLLLTSPPLLNKRSQKNVRDVLDMIQVNAVQLRERLGYYV